MSVPTSDNQQMISVRACEEGRDILPFVKQIQRLNKLTSAKNKIFNFIDLMITMYDVSLFSSFAKS
jgi:hypothetical protein